MEVRIIQKRDRFVVQKRVSFLGIKYWVNPYINLFSIDGDPMRFDSLEEAEMYYNELLDYYKSPKQKLIKQSK
jgi:hypothetical protein